MISDVITIVIPILGVALFILWLANGRKVTVHNTSSLPIMDTSDSKLGGRFHFFREVLMFGMFLWLFLAPFVGLPYGNNPNFSNTTLLVLHICALPVSFFSLLIADRKKKKDGLVSAFPYLKIPFYYAGFAILIITILQFYTQ